MHSINMRGVRWHHKPASCPAGLKASLSRGWNLELWSYGLLTFVRSILFHFIFVSAFSSKKKKKKCSPKNGHLLSLFFSKFIALFFIIIKWTQTMCDCFFWPFSICCAVLLFLSHLFNNCACLKNWTALNHLTIWCCKSVPWVHRGCKYAWTGFYNLYFSSSGQAFCSN